MEFQTATQISPEILQNISYDLFILASGYEKRSVYLPQNYQIKATYKIALAFKEKTGETQRKNNDQYLSKQGFRLITACGDHNLDLDNVFSEVFRNNKVDHRYILIDYSSMTKVWYAEIINYLNFYSCSSCNLTVHFSYTPAQYSEPKRTSPVKINKLISLPGRSSSDSQKPAALIIGLGLDKAHAEYIRKTVNPALTILFYADPAFEKKYIERVFSNNKDLIEDIEIRNLISFPLHDLEKTNEILTNLCLCLRAKYKLIIAPLGPKVFSLLALLLSSRYPDISVVRVSSGSATPVLEKNPGGQPLVLAVEYEVD